MSKKRLSKKYNKFSKYLRNRRQYWEILPLHIMAPVRHHSHDSVHKPRLIKGLAKHREQDVRYRFDRGVTQDCKTRWTALSTRKPTPQCHTHLESTESGDRGEQLRGSTHGNHEEVVRKAATVNTLIESGKS